MRLRKAAVDTLQQALMLMREPSRRFALRSEPLADDILFLIRIAAGANDALETAQRSTGKPRDLLVEAARFYLQEVLLFPGADAYRILGVSPDASIERLRIHHRWMLRWLHPDRAGTAWEPGFAARVNVAWDRLRVSGRRQAYQARQARTRAATWTTAPASRSRAMVRERAATRRGLRASLLLGGCALAAVALWLVLADGRQDAPTMLADSQSPPVLPPPSSVVAAASPSSDRPLAPPPDIDSGPAADASIAVVEPEPPPPVPVPVNSITAASAGARSTSTAAAQPAPLADEADPVEAVAEAAEATEPAQADDREPDFERIQLAHASGRQVIAFLADRDGGVGLAWQDAAVQNMARRQREALHARHGAQGGAEVALSDQRWRISSRRAVLDAGYLLPSGADEPLRGRLRVVLGWQDGGWHVADFVLGAPA